MTLRARIILVSLVAVAATLSAGAYAYWHFLLRGPLAGELFHDFGEVPIHGELVPVDHTFRLTNRLDQPLTIVAIRPDCGCLTARDINQTVQPGEVFELPVTLQAKGGERVVIIRVIFDDDTQTTLRVRAYGRYQPRLHMNPPAVALETDGSAEFTLLLDTYADWKDPVAPSIESASEDIGAEFIGWTLKFRPKDVALTPTHWEGRVRVSYRGDASTVSESDFLTISWPQAHSLQVALKPPGTVLQPAMPRLSVP